jgi:penicillin-binding protein 2
MEKIKKEIKNNKNNNPFVIREGRFKKGRLSNFSYRKEWTEDSYIRGNQSSELIGKTFNHEGVIYKLIFVFVFLFIFILMSRAAWLQVVKNDYYYQVAEGNRVRIERVDAKRGVIYDKNMNPLVRNAANFMLYFTPIDLPREENEKNELFNKISELLVDDKNSKEDIYSQITETISKVEIGTLESYSPLFIKDNIPYETAMIFYLESEKMPGVVLTSKSRREYNLYSLSLSHILGYTGKINEREFLEYGDEYLSIDYIGKSGIEYFWENELKGVGGKKHVEVDALGNEKKIISINPAEDGNNLVLSLDISAQKKLEEIIINTLEKLKLNKAVGIVMNPNNGEIIASVNFPSFDNNAFAKGISSEEYKRLIEHPDNPLFNRAISGEYPSGSVFKPIVAVAALEEGVISERTSFNSTGGVRISSWFFPDWKAGGHGITDVRKAISESVNTFFYYIGGGHDDFQGLGVDRIFNYGKLFGLGSQTGVDLANEKKGLMPSREWKEEVKGEKWYIGDTYHFAIGQGDVLVTPLQVANYTTAFANKGTLYRPHFIKLILNSSDKEIKKVEATPIRSDFIDDYNLEVVRQGMRDAVNYGSARNLSNLPVQAAGKTGTAQWSTKKENHAWFTGFAPYDNPEIVITVLVEEGGEGSAVAVPIAREFMEWYFGEKEEGGEEK